MYHIFFLCPHLAYPIFWWGLLVLTLDLLRPAPLPPPYPFDPGSLPNPQYPHPPSLLPSIWDSPVTPLRALLFLLTNQPMLTHVGPCFKSRDGGLAVILHHFRWFWKRAFSNIKLHREKFCLLSNCFLNLLRRWRKKSSDSADLSWTPGLPPQPWVIYLLTEVADLKLILQNPFEDGRM